MQSNNQNSVCDFSGEIVSYVYDEILPNEKTVFETHLAKCRNCADELAAFSEVHFALDDWRENAFAPLATPEIFIPYHEPGIKRGLVDDRQPTLIEQLRNLFGFSSNRKLAGAAFAVLTVCAAMVLLAVNYSHPNEIAVISPVGSDQKNVAAAAETPAPFDENAISNDNAGDDKSLPAPVVKSNDKDNKVILATEKQPNARQKNQKVIEIPVRNVRPLNARQPSAETVAVNQTNNAKPARLAGDDDDIKDDSLRLSELFDEDDKQD